MKNPLEYGGIYPDMTNATYHAAPGVGSSKLRRILRTPAHMHSQVISQPTPNMEQGTLIHTAVLEPERFEDSVLICEARRGTVAWKKAEKQAAAKDQLVSKREPVDIALAVRDAVHRKPFISSLITAKGAMVEHSAFHKNSDGILLKVRPDLVSPDDRVMTDLKSTHSAAPDSFERSIGDFGYHIQQAMYLDVWKAAGGAEIDGFLFIAVEKEPPYESAIYEIDAKSLCEGGERYLEALRRYAECLKKDEWPGYPERVLTLSLKPWHFSKPNPDSPRGLLGFPIA